jgi:hypothetical protein
MEFGNISLISFRIRGWLQEIKLRYFSLDLGIVENGRNDNISLGVRSLSSYIRYKDVDI